MFHLPILETRTHAWPDEAACSQCASAWARHLLAHAQHLNACLELHGPLGAGKTTFVRHLLHALGVQERVKSPTYAVMQAYELNVTAGTHPLALQISHFDFYRFNDPQEWEDAGFRDVYASPGLKLAEWPEQAAGLLPTPDLRIRIDPLAGDERSTTYTAHTPLGLALLAW
jgi:tRNA threonylcarbamoyladenosine biosynthesis protein TsaE